MSGRDLVRGLRDTWAPPSKPQRGGMLDFLIVVAAIVAVASLGYYGYATWLTL